MTTTSEQYNGREQAYVKHFLLQNYFSDLIHKIASTYDTIVYIDGFSGPWQSVGDNFSDTSFGIALEAMRSAKRAWQDKARDVQMHALLVESRKPAFKELEKIPAQYPDIVVRTYHGEFVPLVPTLLKDMPSQSFAFIFIDPKGWGIDIGALTPLLRWPNAEVLYNFMFDFINRFVPASDPATAKSIDALIGSGDWRQRWEEARPSEQRSIADVRKEILVGAFSQTLSKVGGYEFVAETPIFRPHADRTLYSLIYATRKPPGMEVFRRAQIKTLREQERVRKDVQQAKASGQQMEAFLPLEMTFSETEEYLKVERNNAEALLLDLAGVDGAPCIYRDIWPRVLARHAVTKTDLNQIAAALRKDERLIFPDWGPRQRVPSDADRVYRRQ